MKPFRRSPAPTRRDFLTQSAAWTLVAATLGSSSVRAEPAARTPPRYRISVCDWMLLKRQKLGAFQLAKDTGCDGLEVDMGSLGQRETFDSQLGDPAVRRQFLDKARELGLEISSIAMSGFYAQSFAKRPGVERLVSDCIATMQAMSVKVAFLPLGVMGDLVKHPELRADIVARLAAAGQLAEKAGVILGVETALDAAGEVKLLEEVGSRAVRSYFNFSNALQNGRDVCAELETLGRDRLGQIHCTNQDGVWLEKDPKVDLPKIKRTLDALGWSGWLVMERSRDASRSRDVKWNYGANAKYLKSVFQTA